MINKTELGRHLSKQMVSPKIAVIGDYMIDEYLHGNTDRISPEAPVPVVKLLKRELLPGGAGNVLVNLKALGATVTPYTVVGRTDCEPLTYPLRPIVEHFLGMFGDESRRTTKKTRVLANGQQVCRIDLENTKPIDSKWEIAIVEQLIKDAPWDGIVISDYCKGVVTEGLAKEIMRQNLCEFVVVDTKKKDLNIFNGAYAITPNAKEAIDMGGMDEIKKHFKTVCITMGGEGVDISWNDSREHIPANKVEVCDITGAGDTFVSAFLYGLCVGMPDFYAAYMANVAAGISVRHKGVKAVSRSEVLHELHML